MRRNFHAVAAAGLAIGLVASACGASSTSGSSTTEATSSSKSAPSNAMTAQQTTPPSGSTNADLASLIPTPANTQRTDGPDSIDGNGIHTHFLVNGAPTAVTDAYKAALEGNGWSLTVVNAGGGQGGGGATYTGNNGNAYGVFTGGGYGNTTDVDACAWPSKPANTNCGRS